MTIFSQSACFDVRTVVSDGLETAVTSVLHDVVFLRLKNIIHPIISKQLNKYVIRYVKPGYLGCLAPHPSEGSLISSFFLTLNCLSGTFYVKCCRLCKEVVLEEWGSLNTNAKLAVHSLCVSTRAQ